MSRARAKANQGVAISTGYEPFVMLWATHQLFSAQPRLCSGFVILEGFSSLASPGHAL